jgi:hypothetical protein
MGKGRNGTFSIEIIDVEGPFSSRGKAKKVCIEITEDSCFVFVFCKSLAIGFKELNPIRPHAREGAGIKEPAIFVPVTNNIHTIYTSNITIVRKSNLSPMWLPNGKIVIAHHLPMELPNGKIIVLSYLVVSC